MAAGIARAKRERMSLIRTYGISTVGGAWRIWATQPNQPGEPQPPPAPGPNPAPEEPTHPFDPDPYPKYEDAPPVTPTDSPPFDAGTPIVA